MRVMFSLPEEVANKIKAYGDKTGLKYSTIVLLAVKQFFSEVEKSEASTPKVVKQEPQFINGG